VKQYNEAVSAIDEGVGRIVEALDKTGQLDNTIIIFTSDQGFAWGDHGLRDKRYPYDAALRNPLIVYAPNRFVRGATCDHPVNGLDIVRTIHSMAEVAPGVQLDGRDFSMLLSQPDHDHTWTDEPMIQTYTVNKYDSSVIEEAIRARDWEALKFDNSPAWILLHDGRFKYTRYLAEDCIEELYDLQTDPDELDNLAIKIEWKTKLAKMRQETEAAFLAKGAGFVDLLPQPKTGF
jgi:arylsulfatase A-like enzyme